MRLPVRYVGGVYFRTTSIGNLLSLVLGIRRWLYRQRSELGGVFEACDDLLLTGDAYSAEEKHRARAVVRIVMTSVPQLVSAAS